MALRPTFWVPLGALFLGLMAPRAGAYIDTAPSLGTVVATSTSIVMLQVEKVSVEKRAILWKKIGDVKGKNPAEQFKHQITDGGHPREPRGILDWARPGRVAIGFVNDKVFWTYIGRLWYESAAGEESWWRMTRGCPEILYSYAGTVERLRQAAVDMTAGKEVVVPAVSYAGTNPQGGFAMAIHYRSSLRGVPLCRLKASVKLTSYRPEQLVGPNGGTEADVPALLPALEGPARADAAEELSRIGPPAKAAVPALVKLLKDKDVDVRLAAASALAAIEPGNAAILPAVVAELKGEQRKTAAEVLGDLGAPGVPALIDALKDADAGVRWSAAESLGRIGVAAKAAVPALTAALDDKEVRSIAADALAAMGPEAKPAIPGLVKIIRTEKDRPLRYTAGVALFRIDKASAGPASPLLAEELRNPDGRARHDAITLLVSIGPAGQEATPVLIEMLKDKASYARHMASHALGYGRDPRAAAPLLEAFEKDAEIVVRNTAIQSLGLLGPDAKAAVPALEARLKDPDVGTRLSAAEALWRINKDAAKAVPVIVDGLKSEKDWYVGFASGILGRMGADAKLAVPELKEMLKHPRETQRRVAAQLLKSIDPKALDK
ncbi:MAG TPA: HEAT repeat domain-containing protein [Planctomycetota bacterium]